jgi:TonB-dependent starch-binding outer membrane protein SusC
MLLKRINSKVFSFSIYVLFKNTQQHLSSEQYHKLYFLKSFHTTSITYLIHFLYFLNQKKRLLMPKLSALRPVLILLATFFISSFIYAQKIVTGVVKDNNGPLFGATVSVKGTNVSTSSDASGAFSITVPKGSSTIVVSSVTYDSKEVKLKDDQSTVDVSLALSNNALDEVVVTGYTSQKKKDLTGAVSIVKPGDLTKVASPSFAQQIEGRASGVQVTTSGAAGAGASIRIRGISTFNSGGGEPLVVIDGVQTRGPFFNDINPNDIESMQVLKDAATLASYGIGSTNGVIIITTKKGKTGQPKIEYSGYYGAQTAVRGYDKFLIKTSQEYANLVFQANNNAGLWPLANNTTISRAYGQGAAPVLPDYVNPLPALAGQPNNPGTYNYPNNLIMKANKQGTNWWDALMRTAPMMEHNVSASGGTDKGRYFFSFNYFNQDGTMRYTDFKRYTVRANTEFKVKGFTFGENISLGFQNSVGTPGGNQSEQNSFVSGVLKMQPIIPIYDEGGNWGGNKGGFGNGRNGLAEAFRNKDNRGEFFKMTGNVFAELRFLSHFSGRVNFGLNYGTNFFKGFTFIDPEAEEPRGATGFSEEVQRYNSWVFTEQLNYDNQIGNHNIKAIALHEAQLGNFRGINGALSNYFLTDPSLWYVQTGLADPATRAVSSFGGSGPAKESYMGRVEYSYKGKYLLNGTLRYDQSSVFPVLKGGTFGGIGLAWVISDESFMQQIKAVNSLKLRVAYGTTGNDQVAGGRAYSAFSGGAGSTFYDINGTNTSTVTGYTATALGNPGLKWETQKQFNVGVDALLLKNRLDISMDVYQRTNKDFLFARQFPGTFPYDVSTPVENLGSISNKGVEFSANWKDNINKDWSYSIGVNFTRNKNKIVDLAKDLGLTSFFANGVETRIGPLVRHEIGNPVSTFYGYTVAGIFQNAAEVAAAPTQAGAKVGRFRWKDINGDKKIDDLDKGVIGDPNPGLVFGVNLTAAYKGFDISMFMQGTTGNEIFNYTRYFTDFFGFNGNRSNRMLYESWTPTRPNAKLPLLDVTDNFSQTPSSYYVEDGSYLRCKVLQLGYKLPSALLNKYKIDGIRVYVQAQNLFTITNYGGLDPALGTRSNGNAPDAYFGIDGGNYPVSRVLSAGLTLRF